MLRINTRIPGAMRASASGAARSAGSSSPSSTISARAKGLPNSSRLAPTTSRFSSTRSTSAPNPVKSTRRTSTSSSTSISRSSMAPASPASSRPSSSTSSSASIPWMVPSENGWVDSLTSGMRGMGLKTLSKNSVRGSDLGGATQRDAHAKEIQKRAEDLGRRTLATSAGSAGSASAGNTILDLQVTTLPSGLRVTSESTPGHFQAIGVYIDAGSRYEWAGTSGISHLIDRMAFKTTSDRSSSDISNMIDSLGSQVVCSSSRETIMYQSTVFPRDVPQAMRLMASSILRPLLLPEELESQKLAAAYEIREIWNKAELILPELLHSVAYENNTLGMPLLCPEERLAEITPESIRSFMDTWFKPERMVVAGVGMPHEELVSLVQEHFAPLASGTTASSRRTLHSNTAASSSTPHLSKGFATANHQNSGLTPSFEELANAKARYTGGELMVSKPDEEFTHVYIGFEGLGIHDPDIYSLATLQMLLGGGGSFSAGGPGKGMYTRLYTNVLNRFYNVDFCAGFHHCYADTGLFGIAASVVPTFNSSIGNIIAHQLDTLTRPMKGGVTETELNRAKNQLKSSLVMALEMRSVEVEDLGRQTQVHGKKVAVDEMCAKIDAVTLKDIHRTATRVLRPSESPEKPLNSGLGSGQPTILAYGKLDGLGDLKSVLQSWGLGRGGVPPRAWVS